MWLVATVLDCVIAAKRLLNQFSSEYCIDLKHGQNTAKDVLASQIIWGDRQDIEDVRILFI